MYEGRSYLDIRCQNQTVIKATLSVIQKKKHPFKFILLPETTIWSESPVGDVSCALRR